jgi:SAM-dependent methyltransferase
MFQTLPKTPEFLACDFERLPFENEFDAVVFFDSLHHAVDPGAAISRAFRALKPKGWMIASEPGAGHAEHSREFAQQFDVTDRDTPPSLVLRLGLKAGFSEGRIFPHAELLGPSLYRRNSGLLSRVDGLLRAVFHTVMARRNGIIVLVK